MIDSIELIKVIEYSEFFVGDSPIDIKETLKLYSRNKLVRIATILSHHYGNMYFPDENNTLFSESSKKYMSYLNKKFSDYVKKYSTYQNQRFAILTYRTTLELWREIFALPSIEYQDTIREEDIELSLFKILLTINENIMAFRHKEVDVFELDELMFLNQFITNDTNQYSFKSVLKSQLYYFYSFVQSVSKNQILTDASFALFKQWGIGSWQQYLATLMYISSETEKYISEKQKGVPIINIEKLLERDETGLISASLIEKLSVEEEADIPYNSNVDFKIFRSKPLIKLSESKEFVVINNQLLCERIFNSLFFDLKPLINGREGSVGFYDFNNSFVEKHLFRDTFFKCINLAVVFTYPAKNSTEKEEPHSPDFYFRYKEKIVLVECKAIKMNGEIKDYGDYVRMLDELHEKLVLKTRNLDPILKNHKKKPTPIGIGQLLYNIDKIEEDEFQWDNNIPDEVCYYPILVLEDVRLFQPGFLSILNRWFNEEVGKMNELSHIACKPIMAVSIDTLFLYDDYIRRKGLTNIIDEFVLSNSNYKNGNIILNWDANFDSYLRQNTFRKDFISPWLKEKIK